jgi:hypothetical protein
MARGHISEEWPTLRSALMESRTRFRNISEISAILMKDTVVSPLAATAFE